MATVLCPPSAFDLGKCSWVGIQSGSSGVTGSKYSRPPSSIGQRHSGIWQASCSCNPSQRRRSRSRAHPSPSAERRLLVHALDRAPCSTSHDAIPGPPRSANMIKSDEGPPDAAWPDHHQRRAPEGLRARSRSRLSEAEPGVRVSTMLRDTCPRCPATSRRAPGRIRTRRERARTAVSRDVLVISGGSDFRNRLRRADSSGALPCRQHAWRPDG